MAEAIDWLNLKKASGANGLTAKSFKAAKDVLSHHLAADFSQFWPQGPEEFLASGNMPRWSQSSKAKA